MDLIVVGALLLGLAAVTQWTLAPSLPADDTMIYEFSSSDESLQAAPLQTLLLTVETHDKSVQQHEHVFILYYAPWDHFSQRLFPI
jgi:hypothetical protein